MCNDILLLSSLIHELGRIICPLPTILMILNVCTLSKWWTVFELVMVDSRDLSEAMMDLYFRKGIGSDNYSSGISWDKYCSLNVVDVWWKELRKLRIVASLYANFGWSVRSEMIHIMCPQFVVTQSVWPFKWIDIKVYSYPYHTRNTYIFIHQYFKTPVYLELKFTNNLF